MNKLRRRRELLAMLALMLVVAGCGDDASKPYFEFAGGGFIFNYRTANHYYGFVVRPKRPLPAGCTLEARFEVPNGLEQVFEQPARQGQLQYVFQTGDLDGIIKDHPYKAVLRVIDATGTEIAKYEKTFKTDVDQSTLPRDPLVVGPGYQQP